MWGRGLGGGGARAEGGERGGQSWLFGETAEVCDDRLFQGLYECVVRGDQEDLDLVSSNQGFDF